ncbi:hypothetical protein FA13DRAFT_1801842 [Coprinellus micaceus]|uniref:Uncharacterized protein n=1 Tax=Coprinellus micaceus TaxID=71717 RepID=A0A4Y7SDE7_COPMI|nr:hypothetical protein FA13DRAFT_1801842 [Coprinellus micaceus]
MLSKAKDDRIHRKAVDWKVTTDAFLTIPYPPAYTPPPVQPHLLLPNSDPDASPNHQDSSLSPANSPPYDVRDDDAHMSSTLDSLNRPSLLHTVRLKTEDFRLSPELLDHPIRRICEPRARLPHVGTQTPPPPTHPDHFQGLLTPSLVRRRH